MKKYTVVLTYTMSRKSDGWHFEEETRVISANDLLDAYVNACSIGILEAETFLGPDNEPIDWAFLGVCDIRETDENLIHQSINYKEYSAEESKLIYFKKHKEIEMLARKMETLELPFEKCI